jgi:AraC-like DNA-binding protein
LTVPIISVQAFAKFTIIAIARRCGFNSKTSFYRIFKNEAGKTPADYQKELKQHCRENQG